ncbi:MAG TPA: S4 domain-containing protein, partial [Acidimicrobiales bacterium]|nr:S4 domain-containing protein [Acidimicrobiales bacterium]
LALDEETRAHPARRAAQRRLATELVTFVHSAADAKAVAETSEKLFDESIASLDLGAFEAATAEAPSTELAKAELDGLALTELLRRTGVCGSLGEARRAIDQGGIYVNNRRVEGPDASVSAGDLLHGRYLLLRRGKRHQHLVVAR